MNAVLTVADRTQLPHALALGESLRLHHPDFEFILGWVDSWTVPNLPEWVKLLAVESVVAEPQWDAMQEIYADFELTVACRPFFARHVLNDHRDCQQLIFLAPTVQVFASLSPIMSDDALLRLTPHRLGPLPAGSRLDDKRVLNIGMFHSGSWVISAGPATIAMLDWWCTRTTDRAQFDLCQGMCLDQLWLNYLPIYHERVEIIRHDGWHFGLHAVADLPILHSNGQYSIGDAPLLTLDFAGLVSYHPVWSDHTDLARKGPLLLDLQRAYRARLSKMPQPSPGSGARFGRPTRVKSGRGIRKRLVRGLGSLIHRIDTYDLTH